MKEIVFRLHEALPDLEIYKNDEGVVCAKLNFDWADSFDGYMLDEEQYDWIEAETGTDERRLGEAACLLSFPDEIDLGPVPTVWFVRSARLKHVYPYDTKNAAEVSANMDGFLKDGTVTEFNPQEIER